MTIVISGWYGVDNSGDEAILSVFLDQVAAYEEQNVYVLTRHNKRIDELYEVRSAYGLYHWETWGLRGIENLLRGRLWRQLGILRKSRLFVFGGGSLLRDNTTWVNLLRNLDEVILARLMGVPVFFYALGVGPFRSWLGRKCIAFATRCATVVTVRDLDSAARLLELGIPEGKIEVVADPALLLAECDITGKPDLRPCFEFVAKQSKTVFIYPSISLISPDLTGDENALLDQIANALDQLREDHGFSAVFVPLRHASSVDDVDISQRISDRMSANNSTFMVTQMLSPEEIRSLTGFATINLTVRLHALVYAVSNGLPAAAINYEPKVIGNARSFGLEDYVIEIDAEMSANIVRKVVGLHQNIVAEKERLAACLPGLKASAKRTFELMQPFLKD